MHVAFAHNDALNARICVYYTRKGDKLRTSYSQYQLERFLNDQILPRMRGDETLYARVKLCKERVIVTLGAHRPHILPERLLDDRTQHERQLRESLTADQPSSRRRFSCICRVPFEHQLCSQVYCSCYANAVA